MRSQAIYSVTADLPSPPRRATTLLFLALAGLVFWLLHRHGFPGWLDDLRVYEHALQQWRAGRDPYGKPLLSMYFLYPPIFLYAQSALTAILPQNWGWYAYAGVHMLAVCALPLVLARSYFRQPWLGPLFALLVFFASPRFTGVLTFGEMNIASSAYLLAFVAAIPGLRRGRWGWLYLAIFAISMIKITFLLLLLLPMLAGRRQVWLCFLCGFTVAAANLTERAAWPILYAHYQSSLALGILEQQAYGYGIFGILATYHSRKSGVGPWPYIVSALISAFTVAAMLLLRQKIARQQPRQDSANSSIWLALIVMAIILVNPRQMQYDADIALFAGYVVLVDLLRPYLLGPGRLLGLLTLLFLPSLAMPRIVLNPHLHGIYETLLLWQIFWLGYWRLWRQEKIQRRGEAMLVAVRSSDATAHATSV